MKLSVLIPARNECHLQRTIDDILEHSMADTEVIVGLDGWETDIKPHARVHVHHRKVAIGQRAMTNELCLSSNAEFIMKTDAHCSFSPGFDSKLLEEIDRYTILAPLLLPLDGQSWTVNGKKHMAQFVFNTNFVMQHQDGEAGETMCLQGSAWMVWRENYWLWNLGDHSLGSWGSQGVELGIKAFLNGGVCRTTSEAYYGHQFRVHDSDFPYERGESPGKLANTKVIKRFKNRTLRPLIERFKYPADWTPDAVEKLLN